MDLTSLTPPQRACVTHLSGPLLVCAGAGSGKTFMLTQRIVHALTPGSGEGEHAFLDDIDEALVITFTDKAASEIRARVRQALREEGLVDQALKVDGAWISTIHGMCSRILRAHALELGIDPQFKLVMGVQAEEVLSASIAEVVEDGCTDAEAEVLRDALFEEYGTDQVGGMLRTVMSQASVLVAGLDGFVLGPEPVDPRTALRALLQACEEDVDAFTGQNDELMRRNIEILDGLVQERRNLSWDDVGEAFASLEKPTRARGEAKEAQLRVQCALDRLGKERDQVRARSLAATLLDLARETERRYRQRKDEAGVLDASDLIRCTMQAFDEHPDIARRYENAFKLVMVDEFQDTSQLQISMIERIAGTDNVHLCTVGDSQQSIYRFQGADVAVYLRHKRHMTGPVVGARFESLDVNFRSHGDVLAFVRAVCGQPGFFPEEFLDLRTPAGESADRHVLLGGGPRVEVISAEYRYRAAKTADVKRAEAEAIAHRFAALREAGHRPSEMVVLLGATTHALVYAQALRERGFDVIVAGGSKFFEAPEVLLCENLLGCLANPSDSEALLPILTSDMLPVSSEDLLELGTHTPERQTMPIKQNIGLGFYRTDRVPMHASPLLQHALAVIGRAVERLGREKPSVIFARVLAESGWLARLEAEGVEGQAKAGNVLKYVRMVQQAEQERGFDMAQVSRQMRQARAGSTEKPGALAVNGQEAVRIMTVHASKGLEFPLVAVADCYVSPSRPEVCSMSEGENGCNLVLDLKAANRTPTGISGGYVYQPGTDNPAEARTPAEFAGAVKAQSGQKEQEERRRLFYVAATRASEALIVSLSHCVKKDGPGFKGVQVDIVAGLSGGGSDFPADDAIDFGGSMPLHMNRVTVSSPEEGEGHADEAGKVTQPPVERAASIVLPRLAPLDIPVAAVPRRGSDFFSYSAIASDADHLPATRPDDGRAPTRPDEARANTPVSDADAATVFGSALHRACEWLALHASAPEPEVEFRLAAIVRQFGVRDAERLRSAFFRWRSSGVCAKAFSYEGHHPEVPFCIALDDEVLEGEIDLLCQDPESRHAFIVDYKTGGSTAEGAEQLWQKHRLQAQCYAYAALRSGFTSVEATFFRVEQADPDDETQPQVVSYAFDAGDEEALRADIAAARAHAVE